MLNQRRHEQATMMEAQQRQLQHAILQMQERQNQVYKIIILSIHILFTLLSIINIK